MNSFTEDKITTLLDSIKKMLPIQAPLPSFIHNNILQSFEHLNFIDGVNQAQQVYHAKAFLDEDYYLNALEKGRINQRDLKFSLKKKFSDHELEQVTPLFNQKREELYLKLLMAPPQFLPHNNIEWIIGHENDNEIFHHKSDREHIKLTEKRLTEYFITQGYSSMRPILASWQKTAGLHKSMQDYLELILGSENHYQAEIKKRPHRFMFTILWSYCLNLLESDSQGFQKPPLKIHRYRFRDYIIENYSDNYDDFLNPFIIRMLASYMDQGLSYWPSPDKDQGIWKHFLNYFQAKGHLLPIYYSAAAKSMAHYQDEKFSYKHIIWLELSKTPYPEHKWQNYLMELMLDLRGWAGMINKLEHEPHLAPIKSPQLNLEEYVAIRLILERSVVEYYLEKHNLHFSDRSLLKIPAAPYTMHEFAFLLLETILALELPPDQIFKLNQTQIHFLSTLLKDFSPDKRKEIFHTAFEYHLMSKGVHAIKLASQRVDLKKPVRFQIFFCMDDREEALRRYLEESELGIETYGTVGFYGVDMNYIKINHPRKIPQCPAVIKPRKIVKEVPKPLYKAKYLRAQRATINLGRAQLINYYSGRTLIRGLFTTLILGIPSLIPLSLRILSPARARVIDKYFAHFFVTQIETDIAVDHKKDYTESEPNHGYSYEEMRDIALNILKGMGLVKNFAKTIIVTGHGSTSVNNAHIMAYGCGACGGNPGSPNARAFAKIVNMPEVRELIRLAGIDIPSSTYFIGAFHDTCTDEINYHDLESIPVSHLDDFKELQITMQKALTQNAYERCRWFKNAPKRLTPATAIKHVKSRSLSLAEPRPEYGHSNVAFAILGRRSLTKNLFLDRRAFLVSYDPSLDDHEGNILKGLLAASMPVAAGISLDYLFSFMDSDRYGCGSKLPLNLSCLLGVISGAYSDLRLGLPRQAVDIHEPVRLTVIIECDYNLLLKIVERAPRQLMLMMNEWLFVFTIHPQTREIHQYINKEFVLYEDPLDTVIRTELSSEFYVKNKKGENLEFIFTEARV